MRTALLAAGLIAACSPAYAAQTRPNTLVVCADPNNLPFSNQARAGFENRIIELVAHDLGMQVSYVWWAQRRGFARHTLGDALCDVWPGVASEIDSMATTTPYYRSTYVFLSRVDRHLGSLTFDDPRLRRLSIGVQLIGDDATNTPPAHVLAARGLTANVRGFPVYGDYGEPNPPAAIVEAVARGTVDVALVWGPLAGYFSRQTKVPLHMQAADAGETPGPWPMSFDISMGVRRGNEPLRERLDETLAKDKDRIGHILLEYGVPSPSTTER